MNFKRNKRFFQTIFIFIIFIPVSLFSQIRITGKIANQKEEVLELIEVLILNKDSLAIKSELTNSKGEFSLSTEKGEYLLQVRQLGVVLWKQKINAIQDLNLGILKIIVNRQQLEEVIITNKKKLIERKIDRLIFNVENSISATGGDALDALKVTPGIRVQNDAVSMIGKSGMAVMVDDRLMQLSGEDLINFLKTIQSDNIKSIEVITTPPAKYDAEGNNGIVNIKLKKAKKDSWSAIVRSAYKQAKFATGTLGSSFSYNKSKFSVLLDLTKQNGKNIYTNQINYQYPLEKWKSDVYNKNYSNNLSSLIGLGYELTNRTKIGLQYLGNFNKPSTNGNNEINIYNSDTNDLNSRLTSKGNTDFNLNNHSLNLNLITQIDTLGKKMTVDIDYFTYSSQKDNAFNSEKNNYLIQKVTKEYADNSNKQKINNFSSRIDFEMPYKWANLFYGAKVSFTNSNSDVKVLFYNTTDGNYILNSSQIDAFNYKENVQALYFSSYKKINIKWEAKIGLRIEFTQTNGFSKTVNQTNTNDYYKLFPTAYLSYRINGNNNYFLSYSRRIKRASYSNMNPARWYLNSNSYEEGNPFLQPSFSTNLEFSHSYKDLLTTTFSFSKIENGFSQLTIHDIQNNIQKSVRLNYFDALYYGIQENINFSIFKYWTSTISLNAFYSETNAYSEYLQPKYSGWGGDFATTNIFTLNKSKTFTAQLMYEYNFPTRSGESRISSYSNLSLGLKYSLFSKKLQIALIVNDILNTNTSTISSKSGKIDQSFRQFYDSQLFRLSVIYKFGNTDIKINQRKQGNEDEKDRVN